MRVLCFGDSNMYGFDPRMFSGGRYGPTDRWPELLGKLTGWEIINESLCGRKIPRSYDYARVEKLLQAHAPDMFLVMLGTNDLLQGASAEEACARMEVFLHHIRPFCGRILLVAPPALKRGAWVPEDSLVARSVALVREYGKLADTLGLLFVNTSRWQIELAFDGVHFTETGNHAFAENLVTAIKKSGV